MQFSLILILLPLSYLRSLFCKSQRILVSDLFTSLVVVVVVYSIRELLNHCDTLFFPLLLFIFIALLGPSTKSSLNLFIWSSFPFFFSFAAEREREGGGNLNLSFNRFPPLIRGTFVFNAFFNFSFQRFFFQTSASSSSTPKEGGSLFLLLHPSFLILPQVALSQFFGLPYLCFCCFPLSFTSPSTPSITSYHPCPPLPPPPHIPPGRD